MSEERKLVSALEAAQSVVMFTGGLSDDAQFQVKILDLARDAISANFWAAERQRSQSSGPSS